MARSLHDRERNLPMLEQKDIAQLEAYKPPTLLLERYMKEQSCKRKKADKAFIALKQFLYVCATASHRCSPSAEIDPMWHEFLMFSEVYYTFCMKYFDRVIHHHPTKRKMPASYKETYASALKIFGKLDPEFWPEPREERKEAHCGSYALCVDSHCTSSCR